MREKEEETSARPSAHPSVLEPDLGQTLSPTTHILLLGGRNTATFGNHNNVCIQCVYICSCSHLCIYECMKASFASFAHEERKGNVTPSPQANKLRRIIPISHSINISPFCSIHNEEPAATILTRLFHQMWGRERERERKDGRERQA